MQKWIPVKTRKPTKEEQEMYGICDYVFACPLPDNMQDVLITAKRGYVNITTFHNDDYGCYFEYYEDEGEVIAWMQLPAPYKKKKKL